MDEIDELIQAFRGEKTSELANPDHSSKPEFVESLADKLPDTRTHTFLLEVAINREEFDLARWQASS